MCGARRAAGRERQPAALARARGRHAAARLRAGRSGRRLCQLVALVDHVRRRRRRSAEQE